MLYGFDQENQSIFLRWTTHKQNIDKDVNLKPNVKECVLVFNQSNKLIITTVVSPLEKEGEILLPSPTDTKFQIKKLMDVDKYSENDHDPTLFFLLKKFPNERYIKVTGGDQGLINERDISSAEQHKRNSVWDIAFLHWVLQGLHAVIRSMDLTHVNNKTDSMSYDDLVLSIAWSAATATKMFQKMHANGANAGKEYELSNLSSPYNSFIQSVSNEQIDLNKSLYFGYRMTQWLLSEVEKKTLLIPKYDANAPQSKILRGKLRNVQCNLSRSAIKTIYTTDVLLEMVRKAFLDPWRLVYPYNNVSKLPVELQTYSLKTLYPTLTWAVPKTLPDKQISVILKSKHMIRFTFHAFRRNFVGCDPVVASKALEKAASKPPKPAAKKQSSKLLEQAFRPKPLTVKRWLHAASSGGDEVSATNKFVFGGTAPSNARWSWSK